LDAELHKIRKQGYALDLEENTDKGACLAFPIIDQRGYIVAAISVSTTPKRLKEEFDTILNCVKKNAEEISYHIGYSGPYPAINIKPLDMD
jgi:DNA-binding IclR family transcriptional regulator